MVSTLTNQDGPVRDAFVRWVAGQTAVPRAPASLIEHVELSHDYAGLLDTEVAGRRVVWRWLPAAARTRPTTAALAQADVDCWTIEPASLRQRSVHIAVCHGCAGEKKHRCGACAGGGKVICGACNSQRKAYGYAANGAYRLLNCTVCRGRGEVDCAQCRRGIAVCSTCAGEGRLQRWMEIESWQRAVSNVHPVVIARQFAWGDSPTNEALARDGEVLAELDAPHLLSADALGGVSPEWLDVLKLVTTEEERIVRQRLRIVRIPTHQVHYRLGDEEDRVTFSGLRHIDPIALPNAAFDRRATRLRMLRVILVMLAIVIAVASLARGAFYRSVSTLLSLLACSASLVAIDFAAADWTAARLHTPARLVVAAACLLVAMIFAIVALPRVAHAQKLIAAGRLDDAEEELHALRGAAAPSILADLHLEQVRRATTIEAAKRVLAEIPQTLPQYALASGRFDQLVLSTAREDARRRQWSQASAALAFLSDGARGRPDAIDVAESVYVASARESVDRGDWSGAARAILSARRLGVRSMALGQLHDTIGSTAVDAAARARRSGDARARLKQRLIAEAAFAAWESSGDTAESAPLIALRTDMAHDIAAIERSAQRHRKH